MSAKKIIKRISLGECNFLMRIRMRNEDVKGESIEEKCAKGGAQ